MDAPDPGGLGGTFGGNPVACAAGVAVLEEISAPEFRERAAELGERMRGRLEALAERSPQIGEVRGLGPMLGVELVADRDSKKPAPELAKAVTDAAFERGLLLLSCGTYGNVLRTLVPLVVSDEELEQGLGILEESLAHAGAGAA
jgi:4-aminobutyrate aminotransferase/(S)-3-amino-2-methylpropionate transaminase